MASKQIINEAATALHSYGYAVYVSRTGEHGFYTDGAAVVSFGGSWNFALDFSGNYRAAEGENVRFVGTGWMLDRSVGIPSEADADAYIKTLPPRWATGGLAVRRTTPEQHLKTYGISSGYTKFEPTQGDAA